MSGSLVADLAIGPKIWLFLSFTLCVTLFFKFSRVLSVRNLDLFLLFALAPGMMALVGKGGGAEQPWSAFVLLFAGSFLWLVRCLLDLGLSRRPLLEPNLNTAGLTCLTVGVLGLLLAETVSVQVTEGAARNPADPGELAGPEPAGALAKTDAVKRVLTGPLIPAVLKPNPPQVILKRVLASLSHVGLVLGLIAVGWWHFDRPIAGLGMAACYVLLPYTRIAVVDSGQLVPAALVVGSVAYFHRPVVAGGLIGLAAAWMPACLGLVPLWAGFYRQRGTGRFLAAGLGVVALCAIPALLFRDFADGNRELGARTLFEAGLLPNVDPPSHGSFWSGIEAVYRLPVLTAYVILVAVTSFWPSGKNLGELIALSAALLVASQFWYMAEGGTLVVLYLPLVLLMMFRPNLAAKRPLPIEAKPRAAAGQLSPVR